MLSAYTRRLPVFAHMSPLTFFRGMSEAMAIGFTTCSSAGTLPVNMKYPDAVVKRDIASVLPLGATINMDRTALHGRLFPFHRECLGGSKSDL